MVYTEAKKNAILKERGGSNMYIDHDIIIEENLPAMLQEDIADLERYYAEDNWAEYGLLLELFEATVKQFCINGKITRSTGLKLLEKYL